MTVLVTHHPSLPPGAPPMPAPTRSPRSRPHGAPACCLARPRRRVDHRPAPPAAGPGTAGRQRRDAFAERHPMNRPTLWSVPAVRLACAAPVAAGLALAAAVMSAGQSTAAPAAVPANCTQSGTTVTCTCTRGGKSQFTVPQGVNSITATAVGAQGVSLSATRRGERKPGRKLCSREDQK